MGRVSVVGFGSFFVSSEGHSEIGCALAQLLY